MIWFGGALPDLARMTALGEGNLAGLLGIVFTEVGPDWVVARMPVGPQVHQPFGRLHGGASVVLAETVGSVASNMVIDMGQSAAVGLEVNANHLRAARDGWVEARATPESLGRTVHVWTIRLSDDRGKLVCIARLTAAIIANARR